MRDKKPTLGSLLRALRSRLGLTLKDMSERTGIPFSTLSKVEHDRLTLTYDKLQMISERLKVPMSDLFAEPEGVVRAEANGRRSIGRLSDALFVKTPNYDSHYLSPELRRKHMIPIVTRVKARSLEEFGDLVVHDGEEFIYVLEGPVAVHTEFYDPLVLATGESVYIDSKMGHAYLIAPGAQTGLILSVCSSSQEDLIASLPNVVALAPGAEPAPAAPPARRLRRKA